MRAKSAVFAGFTGGRFCGERGIRGVAWFTGGALHGVGRVREVHEGFAGCGSCAGFMALHGGVRDVHRIRGLAGFARGLQGLRGL